MLDITEGLFRRGMREVLIFIVKVFDCQFQLYPNIVCSPTETMVSKPVVLY